MPKGRETDGWAAFAAGARTGARPCDGREPAALSQCLCAARYYAAPHETHRMERDVRDAVGRGFPRAAAVYGAHGLSGAYRAAAGRALFAARLRPRYALWGGFFALVLLCWILHAHIWSIETNISAALPEGEIMRQLDALGVHIGARRSAIDTGRIRWKMLQLQPDMTFFR